MGLGAFLAGGLMQGLGAGLVQKGTLAAQKRRDAALAAMKREETEYSSKLAGDREAAQDQRREAGAMARQDDAQAFTAAQSTAAAKAAQEDREYKSTQDALDRAFRRDEAAKDRRARLQEAFGKPISSYSDEVTGNVTEIYRDPETGANRTETYAGIARKKPEKSSTSSLDGNRRGRSNNTENRPALSTFDR